MQPRFYSISSAPRKHRDEVHLTVAVVKYRTEGELTERGSFLWNELLNLLQLQMAKDPNITVFALIISKS